MADFKKSCFDSLQDYIQEGAKSTLTDYETEYLEVLYLLNNLRRKYGKENAISFIQNPPLNIKYHYARRMFDESVNLFYADDLIEKQAYRNMIFEDLQAAAKVVLQTAKNAKDMEVFGDLMTKAFKAKGLDIPEPPKVPDELYKKPIKVYSLNPEQIKLPKVNRDDLAELIDNLDIQEAEKVRLRQEGGVTDVNFIELLDDQTSKTGSES